MKTSKLAQDLTNLVYQGTKGGSHDTKRERALHAERFANFLLSKNIQITSAENIRITHIEFYVASALENGKSKRSLQNEMASLRGILRDAGKHHLVQNERLSNKALGLSGASRTGTNRAITQDELNQAVANLNASGCHREALALRLMFSLGLRSKEAVRASESLKTWSKELGKGNEITVIYGSKGGRHREVKIFDKAEALAIIHEAIAVSDANNGCLVNGVGGTLASARDRLDNQLRGVFKELGLSAHSARYAFAQHQVDRYMASGFSKRDSLAQTSSDLGHSSDRHRYIGRVYDQR